MSVTIPPVPPSVPPTDSSAVPPPPGGPPVVRLPTWVNVILVLTLFASCGAASKAEDAANQATQAANGVNTGPVSQSVASSAEVEAMCRLLGAVAAKQGINPDAVFPADAGTTDCQTVAQEAATPTR